MTIGTPDQLELVNLRAKHEAVRAVLRRWIGNTIYQQTGRLLDEVAEALDGGRPIGWGSAQPDRSLDALVEQQARVANTDIAALGLQYLAVTVEEHHLQMLVNQEQAAHPNETTEAEHQLQDRHTDAVHRLYEARDAYVAARQQFTSIPPDEKPSDRVTEFDRLAVEAMLMRSALDRIGRGSVQPYVRIANTALAQLGALAPAVETLVAVALFIEVVMRPTPPVGHSVTLSDRDVEALRAAAQVYRSLREQQS